jgi:hypothetical protein
MSFSEEQVKKWVREEVRRVIDTGLFYTTEVDKEAALNVPKSIQPNVQTKTETPSIKEAFLSPKLDELLNYERDAQGVMWAKPKKFLDNGKFREVNEEIKSLGGQYEKGKGWSLP